MHYSEVGLCEGLAPALVPRDQASLSDVTRPKAAATTYMQPESIAFPSDVVPGFTVADMQLAAYHGLKARAGETVDPVVAKDMRKFNRDVASVRMQIPRRGNVISDYIATQGESHAALRALRRIKKSEDSPARIAALASAFRAGNCGEMAAAAQHVLAGSLESAQTVSKITLKKEIDDHAFTIIEAPNYKDAGVGYLVADAWARGPVVYARDSRFGSNPNHFGHTRKLDAVSGAAANDKMHEEMQSIRNTGVLHDVTNQECRVPDAKIDLTPEVIKKKKLWPNCSVLNKTFLNHVRSSKKQLTHLQQINRAGAVINMGGSVRDAVWFANRNRTAEYALLHADFPDSKLLSPARQGKYRIGVLKTQSGSVLNPWS